MVGGLQSAHGCRKAGIFKKIESSTKAKAKEHPWRALKDAAAGRGGGDEIAASGYGWAEGCKQLQGLHPPRFTAYGNDGVVRAPSRASCSTPVLPAPMLQGQAGLQARAVQSRGHQHECCAVHVTTSCLLAFLIQLVLMLNMF